MRSSTPRQWRRKRGWYRRVRLDATPSNLLARALRAARGANCNRRLLETRPSGWPIVDPFVEPAQKGDGVVHITTSGAEPFLKLKYTCHTKYISDGQPVGRAGK